MEERIDSVTKKPYAKNYQGYKDKNCDTTHVSG